MTILEIILCVLGIIASAVLIMVGILLASILCGDWRSR